MFPFRYRSLFRSRWIALLWAVGICWSAVEVAGWSADDDKSAAHVGNAAPDVAANGAASSADGGLAKLEQQVQAFEGTR